MKYLNILAFFLISILLVACSNSSENQGGGTPDPGSGAVQTAPALPQASNDSNTPVLNPVVASPATGLQTTTATGMNPPHGQPGHRCDIPVGSPLSSPAGSVPAAPASTQQTITPGATQQVNVPAQTAATPTAPGMNPPHGQPDHRCDIPVGSPLSSPPGKGPTTPAASQQTVTPVITPQGNAPAPATTTPTAPGMNPPHGQTGHRCDIAVGAPLNSAPAKK